MFSFLMAVLIGFAVNIDNFIIGVQIGMKNRIRLTHNLIISVMTGLCSGCAALLPQLIPEQISRFLNTAGAFLILIFGFYCLLRTDDISAEKKELEPLSFKYSCILGISLSLNCIPPSIGAGMIGIPAFPMAICCTLCSMLCLYISTLVGNYFRQIPSAKILNVFSSILLIITGFAALIM